MIDFVANQDRTDPELLAALMADMDGADALYRPTEFWRAALTRLATEAASGGLERFRSLPGPLSFFVPTYGFPGYAQDPMRFAQVEAELASLKLSDTRCAKHLERAFSGEAQAEADYRVLLAADTPSAPWLEAFSESRIGDPIEQFEFEERRFSRSSLNYALGLAFLKRHCDTSGIRKVLEIGGGFGSLGELLLADTRNDIFYVDVDIPPTLHYATYYLRRIHDAAAVLGYDDTRRAEILDIDEMATTHKAAMLASWQLPRLQGSVDLFVNFISFQEMEPAVVANYLGQVGRLGARFVLLRNIREGKAKAKSPGEVGVNDPILGPMYDGFLPRFRLLATNTMPFGHRTVDGFHSELRLYERAE
jgi:putative sugar O-methyltransferase